MPGDPQECRRNALCCAELAGRAQTPEACQRFLDLSQRWTKLAANLESVQAFLNNTDTNLP